MSGLRHVRLAAPTLLCAAWLAPTAGGDTLTVLTWGGAHAEAQRQALFEPFARQRRIELLSRIYTGELAALGERDEDGRAAHDVIALDARGADAACAAGLLAPLQPARLPTALDGRPAADDFLAPALHPCAVAGSLRSLVFFYDTRAFSGAVPARLVDVFDPLAFPGMRGLPAGARGNLEWALLADGVPPARVYEVLATPGGSARALARLEPLRAQTVWWRGVDEARALLAHARVVISAGHHGLLVPPVLRGELPAAPIWDGQLWQLDYWAVAADSARPELAWDFVAYATAAPAQVELARFLPYGPVRRSALALVHSDLRSWLPSTEAHLAGGMLVDHAFWERHDEQL